MDRQQGDGRGICVARIEGSRPQGQKRCEDHENADKVSPAVFHDLAPLGRKHRGFDVPTAMRIRQLQEKVSVASQSQRSPPGLPSRRTSREHRATMIAAWRG
jgi:hypothetical protein